MAYGFNEDKTKANIEEIATTAGNDKVDKVSGMVLSDNDYTDSDKAIVNGATSQLNNKVDKVAGKQLSTNDFTAAYKTKIDESSYNTFGTGEGLGYDGNNYYSASNPYTCPHDGYVSLRASSRSGYTQLNIIVSSGVTINERISANSNFQDVNIFVKKGMRIYAVTSGEDNMATYYPQTSYS